MSFNWTNFDSVFSFFSSADLSTDLEFSFVSSVMSYDFVSSVVLIFTSSSTMVSTYFSIVFAFSFLDSVLALDLSLS